MWLRYVDKNNFTWGLQSLDVRFGKPAINELTVMFWYSGIGKTEFSFFVAKSNVLAGNKVMYISLELPKYNMFERICKSRAGVSKYEFQTGKYTPQQKDIMESTWSMLEKLEPELLIQKPENCYLSEIDTLIKKWYDAGYRMFVVDNLDKVVVPSIVDNENKRHADVTSHLQNLKNDLPIHIILIHHAKKWMNRQQAESRAWLEWMRGSQKIIDNSGIVFEVFRDMTDEDPLFHNTTEIRQLKDTDGWPKWMHRIVFDKGEYIEYDKDKQLTKHQKRMEFEKKNTPPEVKPF